MPRSKPALRTICAALAGACALAHGAATSAPVAAVKPATDTYFGTVVTDPYRYMEDLSAPAVRQWAGAQDDHARSTLAAIPGRAALRARIAELAAAAAARVADAHLAAGGLVFYAKRGGGEQFRLYVRQGFRGAERLLVDPRALAATGDVAPAIEFSEVSHDGRYVACGVSSGVDGESLIHVVDVATGKVLGAPVEHVQGSHVGWMQDDSGFFYLRLRASPATAPDAGKFMGATARFHRRAGDRPDQDVPAAGAAGGPGLARQEFTLVTPVAGTPWVAATARHGSEGEIDLYVAPVAKALASKPKWRQVFGRESGITAFAVHGDDLYMLSHQNASRYKVLQTSVSHPNVAIAHVVVAPGREVIDHIAAARDALYVQTRDGTAGRLYRVGYARDAQPVAVTLPAAGAVRIVDSDPGRPGVMVSIDAWTHAQVLYSVGPADGQVVDTGLQPVGPFGAPTDLVAEEVLVKSHDGLEVPLSIVHRQDMKLDGSNPAELGGRGVFGLTDDPVLHPRDLAWYELGGVKATCHVRGGGIDGEQWHLAGRQQTKPNTWKDLIACGEYLVRKGYTSAAKLALRGDGAGAIAAGRAMTARPDLWAAVVSEGGALDPLRAEGSAHAVLDIPEFGSVEDRQQFDGLMEMDAFHHVEDGVKYPAALLLHGIDDPRVPAWESMKMAARLQAATTSGRPVLLRLQDDGGREPGGTRSRRPEQAAELWSFVLWQTGDPRFQPAAR
jgi:prolyl oligopeptidase